MKVSLSRVAIALLVLAEAAGGFSLSRFGPVYAAGVFGMLRPWIVLAFMLTVVLWHLRAPVTRGRVQRAGVAVAALHALLLLSLAWSPSTAPREDLVNIVLIPWWRSYSRRTSTFGRSGCSDSSSCLAWVRSRPPSSVSQASEPS